MLAAKMPANGRQRAARERGAENMKLDEYQINVATSDGYIWGIDPMGEQERARYPVINEANDG